MGKADLASAAAQSAHVADFEEEEGDDDDEVIAVSATLKAHRARVVAEIRETERDYVEELSAVIDNYLGPLMSEMQRRELLTPRSIELIFSNIAEIKVCPVTRQVLGWSLTFAPLYCVNVWPCGLAAARLCRRTTSCSTKL